MDGGDPQSRRRWHGDGRVDGFVLARVLRASFTRDRAVAPGERSRTLADGNPASHLSDAGGRPPLHCTPTRTARPVVGPKSLTVVLFLCLPSFGLIVVLIV